MIRFKQLSIKNFLSYGEAPTVIDLDDIGTTLIVGEDLDNTASGTGANGVGKAQPLHCKIKTPTGWTTMGDISIGDVVSTPDGKTATVKGVFPQGVVETYKIYFADGRTTEACGEHLWKVNSHRWRNDKKSNASKIITTKELKQCVDEANIKNKSWYNCTIPMVNHPEVQDVSLPIDPYLLGALIGDGTICYRNIRFTSKDDIIIDAVSNILKEDFSQELSHEKDYNYYVRNTIKRVGYNPVADILNELSLLGTNSHNKFIPKIYLDHASKDQKIRLLQGLMDTDGTVGKNGAVTFCSTSKQLIEDVQYLIRSIGGKAKISSRIPTYSDVFGNKINGKLAYNLLIQYASPKDLFTLPRKQQNINENYQYANAGLRVLRVEKIQDQEAQCIMIDHPDRLYVTDDFIVTHNTVWINALIFALYGKPISNISLDNLINNINKKNMEVSVEFEKDGEIITVSRGRKVTGKGNFAKIFVRPMGVDLDEQLHDETPDSIKNITDFVVEKLSIPYELFVRIVAFAATHTPFLDLPVRHASQANQSDIMEELFRLTQLSVKAESLKIEIRDTKQKLEIKIKHNEQLEKEHERHNKLLDTAQGRVDEWEKEREENITIIEKELTKYKAVPVKEQEKLYKRVDELKVMLVKEKEKQSEIESVVTKISADYTIVKANLKRVEEEKEKILTWKEENTKKVARYKEEADRLPKAHILDEQTTLHQTLKGLMEDLETLVTKESEMKSTIKDTIKAINKAEKELVHLEDEKCPYCLQQYADATNKVDECRETIKIKQQEEIDGTMLLDVVQKNIKKTEKDIEAVSSDIKYSVDQIKEYERLRADYIIKLEELLNEECPHGDKTSVGDMITIISNLKKESAALKEKLSAEAEDLVEIDEVVEALSKELENCENAIVIPSLNELYEIKNKIKQCKDKVKELNGAANPYLEPLKELEDIKLEPIDMDAINELNNLITHQNYLVKLLTKKDSFIRKTLLNKNLAFLNQRLKHYLTALGLPHKVEFTHEMTANISQFGRELDFGNLSSGQKARVNLGLSFSFRDVLQKSHDSINVCMLDEVLDVGLDSVGVQNAARMLKRKARDEDLALYIISHRDEVSNIFDRKMIVQMEKGFSSVKVEN